MKSATRFDCQLYVSAQGAVQVALPKLSAPRYIARFVPISFEALSDPSFGRLLVALDDLPRVAAVVA